MFGTKIDSVDIISLEEVLKRFSDAFQQVCEAQELSKLELGRFRIIFAAAKDYGPLLAHYERLSVVEEEISELRKIVEEIKGSIYLKRITGVCQAFLAKKEFETIVDAANHEKLAKMLRILGFLTQTKVYLF